MWFMKFFLFFILVQSALANQTDQNNRMAYLKQDKNGRYVVYREFDFNKNKFKEKLISDQTLDAYHPEMSPLGDSVAYSIGIIQPGKTVNVQLVIKDLQNGDIEEWTDRANQFIHAEYSGNAQFLVFSGPNPKTGKQNIGIIDLIKERKKGPIRQHKQGNFQVKKYAPTITYIDSQYDCYAPAVSSNGKMIIFHRTLDSSTKSSPKELIRYEVETKTKKLISAPNGHAMFPSLSSDDRFVAYVSKRAGQWDIHRIDLWTGAEAQVTNDMEMEFTPIFAPDNSIYFTRFDQGSVNVPSEIGIFHLSKEQVFKSAQFPTPKEYLNVKGISEYVPSFSGLSDIDIDSLPSFPKPERSSFGAIYHQNKVFIVGGHQGPEHTYPKESFLDRMDVYDVKTKLWTQAASMNIPKHGFQMAAHGNYIYVFGGFAFSDQHSPGWKSLDSIERYDISKNKWEVLKSTLPVRRSSNVSVKVGNQVFLIGGWDSTPKHRGDKEGKFHSSIDIFNLTTESITTSAVTLPSPLRRAFNATVKGDKIYMLGGISEGASHFDWIDNVTVLDTKKMTFKEETKLPYATFAPGAGFINNRLYLIGGMVLRNKATYDLDYVDDVYEYHLDSGSWTHLGKYLKENKGFPQVVNMPNHTLGVLGGHTYIKDSSGRVIDHPVDSFDIIQLK